MSRCTVPLKRWVPASGKPLASAPRQPISLRDPSPKDPPCIYLRDPSLPPKVDVVVLSRILHDWDLPHCQRLLALAHRLLRPGGSILVAEMLLDPDGLGPLPALLQVRCLFGSGALTQVGMEGVCFRESVDEA